MYTQQRLIAKINELNEEQAKMLLVEIFAARQYGNQEMIQVINAMADRIAQENE